MLLIDFQTIQLDYKQTEKWIFFIYFFYLFCFSRIKCNF